MMAENRFSLRIALGQDLREARVNCPSHRLEQREQDGRSVLVLADETAAMEGKDGILSVSLVHGFSWSDFPEMGASVVVVADGDGANFISLN